MYEITVHISPCAIEAAEIIHTLQFQGHFLGIHTSRQEMSNLITV